MQEKVVIFHLKEGDGNPMSEEQCDRLLSYPSVIAVEEKDIYSLQVEDIQPYLRSELVLVLWNVAVRE